jgi:flagellar biosynthesis protein FliR
VIEASLLQLFVAMLRPAGMMLIAPLFSANSFPLLLRLLLCVLFAVFTYADIDGSISVVEFQENYLAYILFELMIGIIIGFVMQTGFAAALMAGELISNMMGLGFAANIDPSVGQNTAILGQLFSVLLMLTFLLLDGHLFLFGLLSESLLTIPPGIDGISSTSIKSILDFTIYIFSHGILLALPVCAFLFAVNLILSVLARMTPQLNLFALGMPFTVFAGSIFLLLALPYILHFLGVIVTDSHDMSVLVMAELGRE